MGSASSKAARGTTRKYPSAPSSATSRKATPAQAPEPKARPGNNDGTTRPDGMDPDATVHGDFSQRLQQMGIVQPTPTFSPSSTAKSSITPRTPTPGSSNPILSALEARRRLQHQAEVEFEEMGTGNVGGRRFMDMRTLVDAIRLLDQGMAQSEIERRLNLRSGLLDKLGRPGVLSHEAAV